MLPQLGGIFGINISVSNLHRDEAKNKKKKLANSSSLEFDNLIAGFNSGVDQGPAPGLPTKIIKTRSATVARTGKNSRRVSKLLQFEE